MAAVLDEPDSFFKGYSKRNSESVSFSSDGGKLNFVCLCEFCIRVFVNVEKE